MRAAAVIFALFAILQLNDPDPLLWCSLYLLPAFMLWTGQRRQLRLAVGLLYGALAVWWWNYAADGPSCGELFGKIEWPAFFEHETVRESVGLGIVSLSLLFTHPRRPQ